MEGMMKWKLFEFDGKQMLIEREDDEIKVHLEVDHDFIDVITITRTFNDDISDEKFCEHTTQESAEKYHNFIVEQNVEMFK